MYPNDENKERAPKPGLPPGIVREDILALEE
jgi:hypothetical protein